MKITELKDKILIAELDPEKDYLVLVNPAMVRINDLKLAEGTIPRLKGIPIVNVADVDKAIRFVEIPNLPPNKGRKEI